MRNCTPPRSRLRAVAVPVSPAWPTVAILRQSTAPMGRPSSFMGSSRQIARNSGKSAVWVDFAGLASIFRLARRGKPAPFVLSEHEPEKWEPVFGKDHAPGISTGKIQRFKTAKKPAGTPQRRNRTRGKER